MRVAVVGAGIVGVATAVWLQRAGCEVSLVDGMGPGEGASFGNAGVLASCSVVPVTVPGLAWKAWRMALSPGQPLFLKWGYLPRMIPWLARYLSHANARDAARAAAALAPLIGDSLASHQALAEGTGAEKWVVPSDYLFLYRDRKAFEKDSFAWGLRKEHGFSWDVLEGAGEIFRYDPSLGRKADLVVRLRDHGYIYDPGKYVKALAAHVEGRGGMLVREHATGFLREGGRVVGVTAGGEDIRADAVVVATGAWSAPLAEMLGVRVPLESERGYHFEFLRTSGMPRSPCMIVDAKAVATPMAGRLRVAGIVEFGGLDAPPSRGPVDLLRLCAFEHFPALLHDDSRHWLGHRPAPADSIPVIGKVPGAEGAFLGFGHHHIGLTAGAKTGKVLAQLVTGEEPDIPVAPYSPGRFLRG